MPPPREPNQRLRNRKRILLCRSWRDRYLMDQMQLGIRNFTLTHPDWKIGILNAREIVQGREKDALNWKPDGLLILADLSEVSSLFQLRNLPTVVVDLYHRRPEHVSCVEVDGAAVGQLAAGYFLKNHFEHFAVVTVPGNPPHSRLREEGFRAALSARNIHADLFELDFVLQRPWYRNRELEDWLLRLPKPVGIYCVEDAAVQRVMEHCDDLGLRIPSEISLIGTNNNEMVCTSARPRITSIPLPLEQAGFEAAGMLAEAMALCADGKSVPRVHRWVEPIHIEERQSTSLRAIPDPLIAKAVNYLQDHAMEGATVPEAARMAGLNRRTLERGFKKHIGVTPGQFIGEVKIDHARQMLEETNLRMWEIAEACGLSNEYFSRLFKRVTGQTPFSYRKQYSKRVI